ncbi:MAG: Endonuclease 4 [Candidatus Heimdallarchaeota archaeon LC_3]|nr:MAG: Endonuclease 4 [Candidatus Heimdallarchaeota archaeon LC_3]
MVDFGFHLSIKGGPSQAFYNAKELGINSFQIFTRTSRSWSFKPLEQKEIEKFRDFKKNFNKVIVHMPYLPNLASSEEEVYSKSLSSLLDETRRCDQLNIDYLVTHLGSHKGHGMDKGKKNVTSMLEKALELNPQVKIILENTSGTKNSVGSQFEDIAKIIESTSDPNKIGVCFDTCHAFAAGYDLRTLESVERTIEQFNSIIGINKLKVVHLNDSKGEILSKLDRHEHIGLGKIGLNGFKAFLSQKFTKDIPLILETPINEQRDDFGNLKVVKSLLE